MAKREIVLTWQENAADTPWASTEPLPDLATYAHDDTAAAPHFWQRRPLRLAAIGTVLLCMLVMGLVVWQQAQRGYAAIEAEIMTAVDLEGWRIEMGTPALDAAVIDRGAPVNWREQLATHEYTKLRALSDQAVKIHDLALLPGDLAEVTLLIVQDDADPTTAYRTTRFYRLVHGSWRRTLPAPEVWGPEEVIETTHFAFHFRHRDRDAVESTAAAIDAIYANLRRDVGLAGDAAGRLRIDVVLQLPADAAQRVAQNRMAVLSPLVQAVPIHTPTSEILTKSIVHQLVRHVTAEAQLRRTVLPEWFLLLHGVQLWQAYAGSNSLPAWQADLVQWLQTDAAAMRLGEREAAAADLEILCRIYVVWGHTLPLNPSPATLCIDPAWRAHLPYMQPWPHNLRDMVNSLDTESIQDDWAGYWRDRLAASTVVEYLVETYGRDRLPLLLACMGQYRSWEELVPAVTGVSVEEFEAGWQEYVTLRYGTQ